MAWSYKDWCSKSDEFWKTKDIAYANLQSAIGLPGFDPKPIHAYQDKLNEWAAAVREQTERALPRFHRNPSEFYDGSLGKFKMLVLVTVLQRDLGVRYNLKFNEGEYDGTDARNLFLHGVLTGFGGTCVTMPLLYIAIGRRLGYPLFLCEAREHYFVRWEGAGERFNIETSTLGFTPRTDEHYHHWPRGGLSKEQLSHGGYLRNFTPREEIASGWCSRGINFFEHLRMDEAITAFHYAVEMGPDIPGSKGSLARALTAYEILQRMESLPQHLSLKKQIELATPPISQPWHSWGIKHATKDLLRIYRNRRKAARRAKNEGRPCEVKPLKLVKKPPPPPFWNEHIGGFCPCSVGMQKPPCTWPGCPNRRKMAAAVSPPGVPQLQFPVFPAF